MFPYLFDDLSVSMYDGTGMLGYILILFFLLHKKTRPAGTVCRAAEGGSGAHPVLAVVLPLLVHLVAYTFGGLRMASVLPGRSTEFFGYVAVAALGTALAAGCVGARWTVWLDRCASLYAAMASVLKFGCFCAGCCNGLPWAHGLYNHRTQQREFPIQLVEAVLYAVLLVLVCRYKGRPGQRFWLFLTGYAAVRFGVQFFRADRPVFSLFHWMSAVFLVVGAVCMVLCAVLPDKKEETV